jgi:ornithine cyclodeaminase
MQGRMHTRAIANVRDLKKVYLLDKFPEVTQKASLDLSAELGISIEPVPLEDREDCVRASQAVFTVTTGNQVLVEKDWLQPGAFVAKLGSYQEVALDVVTQADKVVVDNWGYVSPRAPELVKLVEEEKFGNDDIYAEWPDIVGGRIKGRESQEEVIVYIALGIWGEYAAILPEAYRRAVSMGLGKQLDITLGKKS